MEGTMLVWGRSTPVRIINLTPHDVVVYTAAGSHSFPASGRVARSDLERRVIGGLELSGTTIPISQSALGEVKGLPESRPGVYYIVSLMVASAAPERGDLLIPDAPLKDGDGRTIGCRSLCLTVASDLAFVGARPANDSRSATSELPAVRVTAEGIPRNTEVGARQLESATETRTDPIPELSLPHRRPSHGHRYVRMSYDAWLHEVAKLLNEQTGRSMRDFTFPWRRSYDEGALPADAYAEVLGHDLFDK